MALSVKAKRHVRSLDREPEVPPHVPHVFLMVSVDDSRELAAGRVPEHVREMAAADLMWTAAKNAAKPESGAR